MIWHLKEISKTPLIACCNLVLVCKDIINAKNGSTCTKRILSTVGTHIAKISIVYIAKKIMWECFVR